MRKLDFYPIQFFPLHYLGKGINLGLSLGHKLTDMEHPTSTHKISEKKNTKPYILSSFGTELHSRYTGNFGHRKKKGISMHKISRDVIHIPIVDIVATISLLRLQHNVFAKLGMTEYNEGFHTWTRLGLDLD